MAEAWVRAQITFTGSLMGDGKILISETYSYRETEDAEATFSSQMHDVDGTCHPEELSYTLWAEMEGHI